MREGGLGSSGILIWPAGWHIMGQARVEETGENVKAEQIVAEELAHLQKRNQYKYDKAPHNTYQPPKERAKTFM